VWDRHGGTVDIGAQLPVPYDNGASAINARGLVVGTQGGGLTRAFIWSPQGGSQVLGVPGDDPQRTPVAGVGLNDAGHVVGWTAVGLEEYGDIAKDPYVWTPSSGFRLLPTRSSSPCCHYAQAINAKGTIVGASAVEAPEFAITAVAWPAPDRIVALNGSDPNPSVAVAINAADVAVGWTATGEGNGINHATLWRVRDVGESAPAVLARTGAIPAGLLARATASVRPSATACLSDRKALRSRPDLIACVARSWQ
jgi:hypothetical protein